jgi:hypothetical protein
MANTITIRRGASSDIPAAGLLGEPLFTTDTYKLYVGTGTGKVLVGGQNAAEIPFSPSGNIAATTVQAALAELDSEKASLAGATFSGAVTFSSTVVGQAPSQDNHFATKAYVDAARMGMDFKESVRVATTGNITLSGLQTLDTITLASGNRVLVKDQTNKVENGIYVASSDAWSRASDATDLSPGTFVFVEEGSTYGDTGFVISTNGTITVGSTSIDWVQFSGAGQISNGNGINKDGAVISVKAYNGIQVDANGVGILLDSTPGLLVSGTGLKVDFGTGANQAARGNHDHTSINKLTITAPTTSATLTIANSKTFTVNNTLTLSGTDGSTLNIGGGGTLGTAAYAATTSFLSSGTTSTQDGYFGDVYLYDDSTPSNYLKVTNGANLTATRTLTVNGGDADRSITLAGNLNLANNFTTSGNFAMTLTATAATNVTLPTTGTLLSDSSTIDGGTW